MPILDVRRLRKTYGDIVAVEDVSFTVEPGEVFGLLGPNGAGKSTTMMMACGLLAADSGSILLAGEELTPRRRDLRRLLGVVPQDLAIYPELTARENLRFFGKLYGLSGRSLAERVDDALARTGLTARADDRADTYSGGMKRRLNFGCAILHSPKLLILDEPTVGIDPQSRSHLLESVEQLSREGMGIIYASHYMEEVQTVCDRVAIVDHGQVVALDTLDALLGRLKSVIRLRVRGLSEELPERFRGAVTFEPSHGGVADLDIDRAKIDALKAAGGPTLSGTLSDLLAFVKDRGGSLLAVETQEPDLERLFLELTGSRLRD